MKFFLTLFFLLSAGMLLAQEEDYVSLEDRLKSNIFLKVEASSTDCFVGEPIIVTYKLYSAMASESSILRRPSFTGFDVKDLKAGPDDIASRESIDGVRFDVHTVLKLQLTPLQEGRLSLGPLTMQNRVRLVTASGKKDPILNGVNEGYSLDNGYFNLSVTSVPIPVIVTALPENTTTSTKFDGLVGDFKMDVRLSEKVVTPGKTASLLITITGKGDFNKIHQPEIQWPDEVEVLPAKVDEDKTQSSDGSGYKSFEIPFTVKNPGKYIIPSIKFAFFDAVNYKYKTITNIPIEFSVVDENSTANVVADKAEDNTFNSNILIISLAILIVIISSIWLLLRSSKKKRSKKSPVLPTAPLSNQAKPISRTTVEEVLKPAFESLNDPGNTFDVQLKQSVIQFLENRFALASGTFNQNNLSDYFAAHNIAIQQQDVQALLAEIDMGIYSGGIMKTDREPLFYKTKRLLTQL